MTLPLFLITFQGSLAYQDQAQGGTATYWQNAPTYVANEAGGTSAYLSTRSPLVGVRAPSAGHLLTGAGEVIVRAQAVAPVSGEQYFFATISGDRLYISRDAGVLYGSYKASRNLTGPAIADGTWFTASITWDGTTVRLYVDDPVTPVATLASSALAGFSTDMGLGTHSSSSFNCDGPFDGAMTFDAPLADAERTTIFDATEWAFTMLEPPAEGDVPIKVKAGGVLVDASGYKVKAGGVLIDVTVGGGS